MGSRYLTELADWCREAGLRVIEDEGWQYRARGSGGFEGDRPWCVMWHHTASNTRPENDVDYICHGSPDAPISNLYLARDATVYVCAGGATNTNGKGGPLEFSRGVVPLDSMNTYAVSIEAANNGVGEVWSSAQIDAYFALSNKLAQALGLWPGDICHHSVWAVGRKVDPATADAVQGAWRPHGVNASGSWSLGDTITEAEARAGSLPPPLPGPDPGPGQPAPPPTKDDVSMVVALDSNGTAWIGDGIQRFPVPDESVFNNYVVLGKAGAYRFVNTNGEVVNGWSNVHEVGNDTIEAMGRA